jgi:hypothetical protein
VTRRDLRVEGEGELAQAAPFPPLPQQIPDRPHHPAVHRRRHALTIRWPAASGNDLRGNDAASTMKQTHGRTAGQIEIWGRLTSPLHPASTRVGSVYLATPKVSKTYGNPSVGEELVASKFIQRQRISPLHLMAGASNAGVGHAAVDVRCAELPAGQAADRDEPAVVGAIDRIAASETLRHVRTLRAEGKPGDWITCATDAPNTDGCPTTSRIEPARVPLVGAAVQPTIGVVPISIPEHWPISAHALAGVPAGVTWSRRPAASQHAGVTAPDKSKKRSTSTGSRSSASPPWGCLSVGDRDRRHAA